MGDELDNGVHSHACAGSRRHPDGRDGIDRSVRRRLTIHRMDIRTGGLDKPEVIELLREHLRSAMELSPPESVHALNLDALRKSGVTFWTVWEGPGLLGLGALKKLDPQHGEIKSMHTASGHQRKGIAALLMRHVLEEASRRSYQRPSLETGPADDFAPAPRLYTRFGFTPCAPFAHYVDDPYSVFMTRKL